MQQGRGAGDFLPVRRFGGGRGEDRIQPGANPGRVVSLQRLQCKASAEVFADAPPGAPVAGQVQAMPVQDQRLRTVAIAHEVGLGQRRQARLQPACGPVRCSGPACVARIQTASRHCTIRFAQGMQVQAGVAVRQPGAAQDGQTQCQPRCLRCLAGQQTAKSHVQIAHVLPG